jgi:hypothetical protein
MAGLLVRSLMTSALTDEGTLPMGAQILQALQDLGQSVQDLGQSVQELRVDIGQLRQDQQIERQ